MQGTVSLAAAIDSSRTPRRPYTVEERIRLHRHTAEELAVARRAAARMLSVEERLSGVEVHPTPESVVQELGLAPSRERLVLHLSASIYREEVTEPEAGRRLTVEEVGLARRRAREVGPVAASLELAEEYGVSRSAVRGAIAGYGGVWASCPELPVREVVGD